MTLEQFNVPRVWDHFSPGSREPTPSLPTDAPEACAPSSAEDVMRDIRRTRDSGLPASRPPLLRGPAQALGGVSFTARFYQSQQTPQKLSLGKILVGKIYWAQYSSNPDDSKSKQTNQTSDDRTYNRMSEIQQITQTTENTQTSASPPPARRMTALWQCGSLSNFHYLDFHARTLLLLLLLLSSSSSLCVLLLLLLCYYYYYYLYYLY